MIDQISQIFLQFNWSFLFNRKNNISKICDINDNINEYIVDPNVFELEFLIKKIKI